MIPLYPVSLQFCFVLCLTYTFVLLSVYFSVCPILGAIPRLSCFGAPQSLSFSLDFCVCPVFNALLTLSFYILMHLSCFWCPSLVVLFLVNLCTGPVFGALVCLSCCPGLFLFVLSSVHFSNCSVVSAYLLMNLNVSPVFSALPCLAFFVLGFCVCVFLHSCGWPILVISCV